MSNKKAIMTRCLDINELRSLYKSRIKKDFPVWERRPLFLLKYLYRNGRYKCIVIEEDEQIIAYSTFICDEAMDSVLLDYLAVESEKQGRGTGGRLLSIIREYWKEKSGLIIECEAPDVAKSESERNIRKRRIDFYIRGGAEKTSVRWGFLGVDYTILWLPIKLAQANVNIADDLAMLYSFSLPRIFRSFLMRIFAKRI